MNDAVELESVQADAQRLLHWLSEFHRVVVAFSGGVDSAVVAAAAQRQLGDRALAVMAISPSVPERQRALAHQVADEIGISFQTIETSETELPEYIQNDSRRCFYCKQTLYATLNKIAARFGDSAILSGTNADDLGDYRPGIQAGRDASVQTPLASLGLGKHSVRRIAKSWGLSIWDLPAGPCLASRIAYGEPVSVRKLKMIDVSEGWFQDHGFPIIRVRYHPGEHARIEVPSDRIAELAMEPFREIMVHKLKAIGFQFVTIDLEGFRSGSLNQVLSIGVKKT